jgi:3-dehydroquinate dehydratase-1
MKSGSSSFIEKIKTKKKHAGIVIALSLDDSYTSNDVSRLLSLGMDIVELRIDLFHNVEIPYVLKEIEKYNNIPVLATVRSKEEGGKWNQSQAQRLNLLQTIAPVVDAIDIELSSIENMSSLIPFLKEVGCNVLISYHNFHKTPTLEVLSGLVNKSKSLGADIVKIACQVHNEHDNAKLATLLERHSDIAQIVIGMGVLGIHSRISFPALGSLITFAANDKFSTGPGQLPLAKIVEMIRCLYPRYH